MNIITRRDFAARALVLGSAVQSLRAAGRLGESNGKAISDVLSSGIARRNIPAVTAMVATKDRITYQGAFGKRDGASGVDVKLDSIFAIASMTKAITSTAALQLVDRGKLTLT